MDLVPKRESKHKDAAEKRQTLMKRWRNNKFWFVRLSYIFFLFLLSDSFYIIIFLIFWFLSLFPLWHFSLNLFQFFFIFGLVYHSLAYISFYYWYKLCLLYLKKKKKTYSFLIILLVILVIQHCKRINLFVTPTSLARVYLDAR